MRSAVTFAVHGRRPITASMDTDLPEPDSPTIARTSPVSTVSETPSTARNQPMAGLEFDGEVLDVEEGHGFGIFSGFAYITVRLGAWCIVTRMETSVTGPIVPIVLNTAEISALA